MAFIRRRRLEVIETQVLTLSGDGVGPLTADDAIAVAMSDS
jgi:hypothetical protein